MGLVKINNISESDILYFAKSNNTGIEFEIALAYILAEPDVRELLMNEIINYHKKGDKIKYIISNTDVSNLGNILNNFKYKDLFFATQLDAIGPADIVLGDNSGELLGLSIKYSNDCNCNISGKNFIPPNKLIELRKELHNTCEDYINEMTNIYGTADKWFRKRKKSKFVDRYIDRLRNVVIGEWEEISVKDKNILFKKLLHMDTQIKFLILKFKKVKGKYKLIVSTNSNIIFDASIVELGKSSLSDISFSIWNNLFAKMQIKFNNGILEEAKGNSFDFEIDNIRMKIGSPFNSWNFKI